MPYGNWAKRNSSFKRHFGLENRKIEAQRMKEKYPHRFPVIVEKSDKSTDIPNVDKKKFMVPGELTLGQFMYVIRKRMNIPAETAIFMFIESILPPTGALMSELYNEKKDEDGFLYFAYSGENTFGRGSDRKRDELLVQIEAYISILL